MFSGAPSRRFFCDQYRDVYPNRCRRVVLNFRSVVVVHGWK